LKRRMGVMKVEPLVSRRTRARKSSTQYEILLNLLLN
jgi:hypothetical protein